MKKALSITLLSICSLFVMGQNSHQWALKVGLGQSTYVDEDFVQSPNASIAGNQEGNYFFMSGEYNLSKRLWVDAGLYYEENSFFTDFSNNCGVKIYGMFGPQGGAKFYFFSLKWLVQPFIGAGMSFNVFNLSKNENKCLVTTNYEGHAELNYSGQAPFMSFAPRLGVEVHIFRSVALTLDYEFRYGVNGNNFGRLAVYDENKNRQIWEMYDKNRRNTLMLGLRVDFPYRKPAQTSVNNLMEFLFNCFRSKSLSKKI